MQNDGHWYVVRGEEETGPFTNEQLRAFAEQGEVKPDDQVWRPGFEDWQRAGDVPGLLRPPERPSSPPPPPVLQESSPAPPLPQRVALEAPTQAEDIQPDAKLVGVIGADIERLAARRAAHKNPYIAPVSGGIIAALIVAAMIWGWEFAGTGTEQDRAQSVDASKVPKPVPVPVPAQRVPPSAAPSVPGILLEDVRPRAPSQPVHQRAAPPAAPTTLPETLLRPGETIEDARKRLEAYKARLEATQKRLKELQEDLDKIAAERQRINARLVETGKLLQLSEAQISVMAARVRELELQQNQSCPVIQQRHETLVAALQKMGRNPQAVTIECSDSAIPIVQDTLTTAFPILELRGQALALAEQLNDLARIMGSIRTERKKMESETARLNEARTRLAALQETKKQSLSERQAELDLVRDAAAKIAKNVEEQIDLVARLEREVTEREAGGKIGR